MKKRPSKEVLVDDKSDKPGRRGKGRMSKLTPEVQARIVQFVEAGNYKRIAAQACGIDQATFCNWMKWGEQQQRGRYFDFFKAVKEAEGRAEANCVAHVALATMNDWRAAAWMLERSRRDRWGQNVTVNGLRELSNEQLIQLLRGVKADQPGVEGEGNDAPASGHRKGDSSRDGGAGDTST